MAYDLDEQQDELDLRDYVAIVRRRWLIIAASFLGLTLLALAWSLLQPKQYQATAEIQIRPAALVDNAFGLNQQPDRLLENERQFLERDQVVTDARAKSGETGQVTIGLDSDTNDSITVSATASTPDGAAALANQTVDTYLSLRRESIIDLNTDEASRAEQRADDLREELARLDEVDDSAEITAKNTRLTDEVRTQEEFKARARLAEEGVADVNRRATPNNTPTAPKPVRNAVLAGVLGLLGGFGIAFLVDYFDDSIRNGEELSKVTDGTPTLAVLPVLSSSSATSGIIALASPDSRAVEAYRALRTSVLFLDVDGTKDVLMLTSPVQGDGKSTTVANLAVLLAKSGKKVALLDLDLRRPRLHSLFGIDGDNGFTTVLTGQTPLRDALVPIPDAGTLWVLPAGPKPPNPSELLGSVRTTDLIARLRPQVDILLIDTAPVLPVTDARVVATAVDGVILVVNADASRRAVKTATELLHNLNLVGTVVNRADSEGPGGGAYGAYGYGYGYGYGYNDTSPEGHDGSSSRLKSLGGMFRRKSKLHTANGPTDGGAVRASAPNTSSTEGSEVEQVQGKATGSNGARATTRRKVQREKKVKDPV